MTHALRLPTHAVVGIGSLEQVPANMIRNCTAVILAMAIGSSAGAAPISVLIDSTPGLVNVADGGHTLSGPAVDAIRRIGAAAGVDLQVKAVVFVRSVIDAKADASTCIAGIAKTPEHEGEFKWAGPISRSRQVLYARGDDALLISDPHELSRLRVGVLRNSVPALWAQKHQMVVEKVADNATNFRKLLAGRINVWAANEIAAQRIIEQAKSLPPRVVYVIGSVDLYIACNLQISDVTMEQLNAGVRQVSRLGQLRGFGIP